MEDHFERLYDNLNQVTGYIYPNEIELHWGLLVVIYPYITGLVAGAFILASLEKVFRDMTSDESGCAGDKYSHYFLVIARSAPHRQVRASDEAIPSLTNKSCL